MGADPPTGSQLNPIMMRKFEIMLLLAVTVISCGPFSENADKDEQVRDAKEWRSTYNGNLLLGLASSYDNWESNGKLSTYIKWEGISVFNGEYLRAGISLFMKMMDEPESWMNEDIVYPPAAVSFVSDDPFLPRIVPFSVLREATNMQYESMCTKGEVDKRFHVGQYESVITNTALNVMLCRAFAYYRDNEAFPESIDTWDASYVRATTRCEIDDPEVSNARDQAWANAGVTEDSTTMQKAVAIFNYARDVWEYEGYSNSTKGAVGTIVSKAGNCCDMSHAVCAMARLSGIPARYFHAQCKYSSGMIGHVVSQLFVDGQWYMADATNNSNEFGEVRFTDYYNDEFFEDLTW